MNVSKLGLKLTYAHQSGIGPKSLLDCTNHIVLGRTSQQGLLDWDKANILSDGLKNASLKLLVFAVLKAPEKNEETFGTEFPSPDFLHQSGYVEIAEAMFILKVVVTNDNLARVG